MQVILFVLVSVCANLSSAWEHENLDLSLNSELVHKGIWPPTTSEVLGYVLMFIVSALANTAGIGGGTIMIPVFVMMFYFETHTAVPLAQVMIFGGAAVAIIIKIRNRHPTRNRPLIFYELIMLVQAPMLLGITFGAIINTILPSWLIELMITLVIGFMCYSTINKAIALFHKESKKLSTECLIPASETELKSVVKFEVNSHDENASSSTKSVELETIVQEEKKILPIKKVAVIIGIWLLVVLFTLIKGGSVPSIVGIEKCSVGYFGLTAGFVCILAMIFIYNLRFVIRDTEVKEALHYNWDETDLKWTKKNAVNFGLLSMVIGFVAGMVGFAGGIMMIPLMLIYGIRPEQAAATSSSMVVFTSSAAILQFSTSNMLNPEYGLAVLFISLMGSLSGILVVRGLIERFHRPSIIVFILAFIMALVVLLVPLYGVSNLIHNYQNGTADLGFRNLCG